MRINENDAESIANNIEKIASGEAKVVSREADTDAAGKSEASIMSVSEYIRYLGTRTEPPA